MADLEVFLSSPGHHVATLGPILEYLAGHGITSRIHSLCEMRGVRTPHNAFTSSGVEVQTLWPLWLRPRGAASRAGTGAGEMRHLRAVHQLAWSAILAPRLRYRLGAAPRLALLPNDSAFPYDRIAAFLRRRGIAFVLVQEGIRFPLPAELTSRYGLGGARALAVWGKASADYFRGVGVDPMRIHVTGSPRFDGYPLVRWQAGRKQSEDRVSLLLITNPIDAQGFCTRAEKTALVARLMAHLRPALVDGRVALTLRPHPGESREEYADALATTDRALVSFDTSADLATALAASDVAIVMASTVGLEALRQGVPLAVLPTPGHGHVHDYVESGAALGVSLRDDLASQLIRHAVPTDAYATAVNSYLEHHLACSGRATEEVGELMIGLLDDE